MLSFVIKIGLFGGRFSGIVEADDTCDFVFDSAVESSYLELNKNYLYLDGYYGERAILAYSDTKKWIKIIFKKSDAVKIPGGCRKIKLNEKVSKGMLIIDGWDHEHCNICWAKIDESSPNCFFNNFDFLCEDCFNNFVIKKDLGFINL